MINKVKVLKLIIVSNLRKIVVIKSLKMKQLNEMNTWCEYLNAISQFYYTV